jgi:hypothetical protein
VDIAQVRHLGSLDVYHDLVTVVAADEDRSAGAKNAQGIWARGDVQEGELPRRIGMAAGVVHSIQYRYAHGVLALRLDYPSQIENMVIGWQPREDKQPSDDSQIWLGRMDTRLRSGCGWD